MTAEATITYHNASPDTLDYLWVQLDQNYFAKRADSRTAPNTKRGVDLKKFSYTALDRLLAAADEALRTSLGTHSATRPCPQPDTLDTTPLSAPEQREVAALMRVNHVGEVCAQALYASQSFGTTDPQLKAHFAEAAREETDHLAWTEQRLRELGGRTSLLNPLWYAGAFAIGLGAARAGGKVSLGFVAETERQVEIGRAHV